MFDRINDIIQFAKSQNIAMIDLKFVDLPGRWHHITIPASSINERLFHTGIPFDSSSIPGFRRANCGDMTLDPDISTGFVDPFMAQRTLSFICNICETNTCDGFDGDPRTVAIRAEKRLADMLGAESIWLPEIEFYLFDEVEYRTGGDFAKYRFRSRESDSSENGFFNRPQAGYHAIPPADSACDIRSEMTYVIENFGIKIRYHHHEVGPYGQNEIEMIPTTLVKAADAVMLLKYAIRLTAKKHGLVATFLPKPLFDEPGNGMHFHQFIRKDGKSLFWNENGKYAHLSDIGLSYIAGLLEHATSLVGITNPSTNSYKRLIPGFEAPTVRIFGLANRCAAIRIPKYDDTMELKRIEFRPSDATCNPYLAISAQLQAGLDGISRNLDPISMRFGPFDDNLEALPNATKKRLKKIPTDIYSALESLEKDKSYLLAGGVFDDGIIERHIYEARKNANDVDMHPSPREMELYFDL